MDSNGYFNFTINSTGQFTNSRTTLVSDLCRDLGFDLLFICSQSCLKICTNLCPTMHVHKLDDLSLLSVFDRLPISDLISAGQVCSKWNAFRAKSASTRRSFTLRIGEKTRSYWENPLFKVPFYWLLKKGDGSYMFSDVSRIAELNEMSIWRRNSLSEACAAFIAGLFSGVTNFMLMIRTPTGHGHIDPIIYLLELWSSKLVHSRIMIWYSDQDYIYDFANLDTHLRLLKVINGLSSLKRLEFYANFPLNSTEGGKIDFPLLAQLEVLEICRTFIMFDSLAYFGESNVVLKKIALSASTRSIDRLIALSPQFASRFSQLGLILTSTNKLNLKSFCAHFTNLTILRIKIFTRLDRALLFGSLTLLTELVYLKIAIDDKLLRSLRFNQDEEEEGAGGPQLNSIKVFFLSIKPRQIRMETHEIIGQLNFHLLFPKLQIFRLERDVQLCNQCTQSGIVPDQYEPACLKPMIEPFVQCAQLQFVQTLNPKKEWPIDVLKVKA